MRPCSTTRAQGSQAEHRSSESLSLRAGGQEGPGSASASPAAQEGWGLVGPRVPTRMSQKQVSPASAHPSPAS